jgi:hypothetical protein
MTNTRLVVVHVSVNQRTEKAVQVRIEDDLFWFPKSQVRGRKRGENSVLIMPYWLASKSGVLATAHNGMDIYPYMLYTEEEVQATFYPNGK